MKICSTILLLVCTISLSGCNPEMINNLIGNGEPETSETELVEQVAEEETLTEQEERAEKIRIAGKRKKRKYRKDLVELDAEVDLADGNYTPYIQRSQCHLEYGNINRAIKDATKAIELANFEDGEKFLAYCVRGQALADAGRYSAAMRDMEEAILLSREIGEGREAFVTQALSFLKGYVYEKQGDYYRALAEYERTLNVADTQALTWNHYAGVLSLAPDDDIRNGDKAVQAAIKAVELSSGSKQLKAVALDTLSSAWAEKGEFEKAIKSAKLAFKTAPGSDADTLKKIDEHIKLYEQEMPVRFEKKEGDFARIAEPVEQEEFAIEESELPISPPPSHTGSASRSKVISRTHYEPAKREAITE